MSTNKIDSVGKSYFPEGVLPSYRSTVRQTIHIHDGNLKDRHWLSASLCIEYKALLVTGTAQGEQSKLPRAVEACPWLRSSGDPWLLAIPRSSGSYGDRSLGILAPRLEFSAG
jgi:hypothetical protein